MSVAAIAASAGAGGATLFSRNEQRLQRAQYPRQYATRAAGSATTPTKTDRRTGSTSGASLDPRTSQLLQVDPKVRDGASRPELEVHGTQWARRHRHSITRSGDRRACQAVVVREEAGRAAAVAIVEHERRT